MCAYVYACVRACVCVLEGVSARMRVIERVSMRA